MGWTGSHGWYRVPCRTNHTIIDWLGSILSTLDARNVTCYGYQHSDSLRILVLDWGLLPEEWLVRISVVSHLFAHDWFPNSRYPYPIFEMASQTQRVALFLGSAALMTGSAALLSLLHQGINGSALKPRSKSKDGWEKRVLVPAEQALTISLIELIFQAFEYPQSMGVTEMRPRSFDMCKCSILASLPEDSSPRARSGPRNVGSASLLICFEHPLTVQSYCLDDMWASLLFA